MGRMQNFALRRMGLGERGGTVRVDIRVKLRVAIGLHGSAKVQGARCGDFGVFQGAAAGYPAGSGVMERPSWLLGLKVDKIKYYQKRSFDKPDLILGIFL